MQETSRKKSPNILLLFSIHGIIYVNIVCLRVFCVDSANMDGNIEERRGNNYYWLNSLGLQYWVLQIINVLLEDLPCVGRAAYLIDITHKKCYKMCKQQILEEGEKTA